MNEQLIMFAKANELVISSIEDINAFELFINSDGYGFEKIFQLTNAFKIGEIEFVKTSRLSSFDKKVMMVFGRFPDDSIEHFCVEKDSFGSIGFLTNGSIDLMRYILSRLDMVEEFFWDDKFE